MSNTDLEKLWKYGSKEEWIKSIEMYDNVVKRNNSVVEQKLNNMKPDDFKKMSGEDFYKFLKDDYLSWKYTDSRRKKTVKNNLEQFYREFKGEFEKIFSGIFTIDKDDIFLHFANVTRIKGIGAAGASGLLAIIFPEYFGTIDRFVVENLQKIYAETDYADKLNSMKGESLTNYDAILLTKILREKANELNEKFKTKEFTPRKIDMVLWALRD